MKFADRYAEIFRRVLPAPFTIAILLTLFTFLICFVFTGGREKGAPYFLDLISDWEGGLWDRYMLVFAFQMMLMLVLGHVLALAKPVKNFMNYLLQFCNNSANAALLVTLFTILVSFFNWGLGLIFGAVFARKIAEYAAQHSIPLNYALIGAGGYSGLLVWHGGISGSAPIKVAEEGHLSELMAGLSTNDHASIIPSSIPLDDTIFSPMNLSISIALILILPTAMYLLAKFSGKEVITLPLQQKSSDGQGKAEGADRLNHSKILAWIFSAFLFIAVILRITAKQETAYFGFIDPDFINLCLLFLGLIFHGNFHNFTSAVEDAITGTAGILIQFPLYFGIMGLIKGSGLINHLSDFFISISSAEDLPLYTMISAAIVNIFVPSGGGQWVIQGPIIIQAATDLGASLPKCIMSMAYGDELTNMMQPFWALPLLGITGLKAKEILPYSLYLMSIGFVIFLLGLMLF